jgi:uncharacterized integral membrane protein (TIGR00698 family)
MTENRTITHTLNAWEKSIFGVRFIRLPSLFPGLMAVGLLTLLSIWLSDFVGEGLLGFEKSPLSPVMIAILLGLSIGSVKPLPKAFAPGLTFAVKKLLKLGIILLGIRLTIFDVFRLGIFGVPVVALCILGALLITSLINKKLNLSPRLGALIAVGTSICGVTAIVATSPAIDADEEESAYAVTVITIFGLFATLVYPYLTELIFDGHALKVGLFLGTAIHDTSQVVGAAKIYADMFAQTLALDVATIAKLVRNVFMALVIPFLTYLYARQTNDDSQTQENKILNLLPTFILGFLGLAVLRSIGDAGLNAGSQAFGLWSESTWSAIITGIKSGAEILLVVALAGVGLGTNFRSFKALGIKPFLVGLSASLSVGVVSFLAITLLGGLVAF